MYNNKNIKMICCEDISKIENYNEAINSEEKYHLHHRYETHDVYGNELKEFISVKELKKMGLYYKRPANELIFLSQEEHLSLHSRGKHNVNSNGISPEHREHLALSHIGNTCRKGTTTSEQGRLNMSIAHKGKEGYWKGKSRAEDTKQKIRQAHLGTHQTTEQKDKISKALKGIKRSEEFKDKIRKSWIVRKQGKGEQQ